MQEEKLYEYVLTKEIENNNLNKGFWAKALSQVTWNENQAKVVYLENRVVFFKEYLQKHNIDYVNIDIDQLDKIVQSALQDNRVIPQQPKVEKNIPIKKSSKQEKEINTAFSEYYFQDDTRVNQKEYLFRTFLPFISFISILAFLIYINSESLNFHAYGAIITVFLIITYFTVYPTMKRLQDINLSAWLSILMFIPIVNVLFIFLLTLAPSYNSENQYGQSGAQYNLNLYSSMGVFLELSILSGLIFSTMNHLGYIKNSNFLENQLVFNSVDEEVVAAYKIEEIPLTKKSEIEDSSTQDITPVDVDTQIAFLDNLEEKEIAVEDSKPLEIERPTSIQEEQLEVATSSENTIDQVSLSNDELDEIAEINLDEDINSQEIVTLSLGPVEQKLEDIYLEDNENKNAAIVQEKKSKEILPTKIVKPKTINKKVKKHQLYLITVPYRSKVTFVDKDLTYKENMELLPGKYKIKVEKKGYTPEYRTINLNNDLVIEFFLKRKS